MFHRKTIFWFGLFSLVGHLAAAVQSAPFFPVKDLRPGMRGVGYTVFSTLKGIEPFEIEILGRMRNQVGPDQDLLIVRLLDKRFTESNVVAGMSGSPVYVDGKLVGALSYSFGHFTTEATAGVTPIANMLLAPSGARTILANNTSKAISLPLVTGGLSPMVARYFEPELKRRGFGMPVSGAGGFGASALKVEKLIPGAPFTVLLITGDMNVSCLGTVTWVDGNRFGGLGHPFLQSGYSELPVAGAEVVTTIFSQQDPYKMGQPTEILGTLQSDRSSGVIGVMGQKPRLMPLEVQVGDKTWHYQIARTQRDTLFFASMAMSNSLAMGTQHELGGTYTLDVSAKLSTGEELNFQRTVAAPGQPLEIGAVVSFLEPLTVLQEQAYRHIEFEKIVVKAKHHAEPRIVNLVSFTAPVDLRPGEAFPMVIHGQSWQKHSEIYRAVLSMPALDWTGSYQVIGLDRVGAMALERESGLWGEVQSYDGVLQQVRSSPKDTEVCFYVKQAALVNQLLGYNLTDLPISLKESLTDVAAGSEVTFNSKAIRLGCVDLGGVVTGKVLKSYGEKRQS